MIQTLNGPRTTSISIRSSIWRKHSQQTTNFEEKRSFKHEEQ